MAVQTKTKIKEQAIWEKENMFNDLTVRQKCRHHWLIESAGGPISQGVCQVCGMKKDFDNYLTDCLKVKGKSL